VTGWDKQYLALSGERDKNLLIMKLTRWELLNATNVSLYKITDV
jgi:hypothetical protein